jgi:hypothetical protein
MSATRTTRTRGNGRHLLVIDGWHPCPLNRLMCDRRATHARIPSGRPFEGRRGRCARPPPERACVLQAHHPHRPQPGPGGLSLRGIAAALDERGIKTRQEAGRWSAQQVARVLARTGEVGEMALLAGI